MSRDEDVIRVAVRKFDKFTMHLASLITTSIKNQSVKVGIDSEVLV